MKYTLSITLLWLLISACFSKQPEKTGLEGKQLPSFDLILIDSTTMNTNNIKTNKPFIFLYFSPSCPFSKAQIAEITDNIDDLKSLQFYLITPYPFHQMKETFDEFDLKHYPNITIGCDSADFFGEHFKVKGFPFIAFYNKNKKLDKVLVGKTSSSQIIKLSSL